MSHIARVMCLVLAFATCPKPALASGEKGSKKEAAEFSQREAQSPGLEKFEGGDATGVLLTILLIAAIVAIVYLLVENNKSHSMKSPADAPSPPPPPLFR